MALEDQPKREKFHKSVGGSMEYYKALAEWQSSRIEKLEEALKKIKDCANEHCNNFDAQNDYVYHTASDVLKNKP
jgi:hypothetical protein